MNNNNSNKFILIADSGATKTDWCLVRSGEIVKRIETKGISPIYQSEKEIADYVSANVYPQFRDKKVEEIYFYGSGCIPEKIAIVKHGLFQAFQIDTIEVYSDLVAAAHALCGKESGIACILGTGSNSCEWDGEKIVSQVSPLGFILGDEGSGAHLGKLLIGDALKNQLPQGMKKELFDKYGVSPADIIENTYRKPFPSRFLASFCPFLSEHIDNEKIRNIVEKAFGDFFERNVMQYDYKKNSVNFVGSIAFYFEEILKQVANNKNIKIGIIQKSPMSGLIKYYSK